MLTLALVAAATGWGAVLAAYSRNAAQANQLGTMIALIFGMLAGNFVPRIALPQWLRTIGLVTPNAWGLEGFSSLTAGGRLAQVVLVAGLWPCSSWPPCSLPLPLWPSAGSTHRRLSRAQATWPLPGTISACSSWSDPSSSSF